MNVPGQLVKSSEQSLPGLDVAYRNLDEPDQNPGQDAYCSGAMVLVPYSEIIPLVLPTAGSYTAEYFREPSVLPKGILLYIEFNIKEITLREKQKYIWGIKYNSFSLNF